MGEQKKSFFSELCAPKIFKAMTGKWIIGICAAAGIILLFLGSFGSSSSDKKISFDDSEKVLSSYTSLLEEKIKNLCMSIDGITSANILLTLENGSEYVYAQNSTNSTDGTRTQQTFDYVLTKKGSDNVTIPVTGIYPNVRGVAVVCTGGDSPSVQSKIISLLSAALGIPSNKISVAGGG